MKPPINIFLILLIFSLFLSILSYKTDDNRKLIRAVRDVISKLFIEPKISFDVVLYKMLKGFDLLAGIGGELSGKVLNVSPSEEDPLKLNQSALIITQNEEDLQEFLNQTQLRNAVAENLKFLLISNEKFDIENLKIPMPNFDAGHIGQFSYFIHETSKEIQLKTFEWFTEIECHERQLITINSFVKSTEKWEKELKIEDKFKNFHGCTLTTFSQIFYYAIMDIVGPKEYTRLREFNVKIVEAIARRGNFTAIFEWDATKNSSDIYYLPRRQVLNDECHVGSRFWQDYSTFMTTDAEIYNSYEKLILTFDRDTWICLIATIAGAFATIFIVNRCSEEVKDIFYGENIRNVGINIVGLFFGLGVTKLPENNFARIIFVTYILFCLVISTAYHGVFFELMTTDVKKPLPNSIEDINDMDFEVYMAIPTHEQYENIKDLIAKL